MFVRKKKYLQAKKHISDLEGELRLTQKRIEESENKFKSIIQHMNEAVVAVNSKLQIIFFNEPFRLEYAAHTDLQVGMSAGLKSKTGTIGFVGGMDIPLIHRFALAYKAGAQYVNPKIIVKENYAGITVDAFNDPTKGKELAKSQISQKADVIFQAAGSTGLGVFDAIEKTDAFGIGVDSNQNWIKPGKILTSMLKRVDVAVYDTIRDAKDGKFQTGRRNFSLKDEGIDYAYDEFNKDLITPEMKTKVDQAKQDIIAGKIIVPDYYTMKKK